MLITSDQLESLLYTCPGLEELFITSVCPDILETPELTGHQLQVFHLTGPERYPPRLETFVGVAQRLPDLQQLGCGNRVYEVLRGTGDVELVRWGRTDIPRYFQIWRG
jgi:hypothetical protein